MRQPAASQKLCGSWGAAIDPLGDIRSEKIILVSRAVLAVGGLFAIYLDPSQPSQGVVGYTFVAAYVVFSLLLLATFGRPLRGRWSVLVHAIEIAIVCAIIVHTEGPSSPFFVYFTFILLVAALRWQGKGTLITGAVLSLVLIALTTSAFVGNFDRADVDRLIIRNIYLIVVSGLFAFLGDLLGRNNQQMERLRLARELHDGILQTLAAVGLRLRTVASKAADDQRTQLLKVVQALNDEQRQLRAFVEKSFDSERAHRNDAKTLSVSDLHALVEHLRLLWSCDIQLRIDCTNATIDPGLGSELKFIIAESVANAVMHGHATAVTIAINQDARAVTLKVKDNGAGFPEVNRGDSYDLARLAADNVGPRSIQQRVMAGRGSLDLTTSSNGVDLLIRLPVIAHARGSTGE